jgi:putative membrane protein
VIGLSCLLAVLFDLELEPFATRAKHYWLWQTHTAVLNWYSAPWVNFLGWFATALGILGFTTPWLINKQPIKLPTDYHPLLMLLLLNAYFTSGSALQQMWLAVGFSAVASLIVTICAMRGARW